MIKLLESITPVTLFKLEPPLAGNVQLFATFQPNESQIDALKTAFWAVIQALRADPVPEPQLFTNVIIYDRDLLTFRFVDETTLGNHVDLVLLPFHRWRARNLNYQQVVTCILEELCHSFWEITDEILVKHKVVAVAQFLDPTITIRDLYPILVLP